MGRSYRLLIAALVAGVLIAGSSYAGIPDPNLSVVNNVLYSPSGTIEYIVTVNGSSGPIDSATVQLVFSTEADGLICWCVGQAHPLIEATTDVNGQAHFFIAAGGCIDPSLVASPPAVEVFANGIKLKEVGCVSPDAVDDSGILPTSGWAPGAFCTVSLADATLHSPPIKSGTYSFCSDVNSDLSVDLTDAVVLTLGIKTGFTCTAQ
jgi:hypothetical protein